MRSAIIAAMSIIAVANFIWFCTLPGTPPGAIVFMAFMMLPLFAGGLMGLVVKIGGVFFDRRVGVLLALLLPFAAGCSVHIPGISTPEADILPWKHRAMAEIAIVSVTSDTAPGPRPGPRVGDKCPTCGDNPGPPIGCEVGETGDGRHCSRCQTCGGDGKIDELDLRFLPGGSFAATGDAPCEHYDEPTLDPVPEPDATPEPQSEPVKSITLKLPVGKEGWGGKWFKEDRQPFIDAGWKVTAEIDTSGEVPAPYFEVRLNGRKEPFYEPLAMELLKGWE